LHSNNGSTAGSQSVVVHSINVLLLKPIRSPGPEPVSGTGVGDRYDGFWWPSGYGSRGR